MKVIFLDIDGVLNTDETYLRLTDSVACIDDFRVGFLKRIVDATGAKIVLSSSNKVHFKKDGDKVVPIRDRDLYAPEFIKVLDEYGLSLYDILPTIKDSEGRELDRQDEIKFWLACNDVESFVILDDETTFLMDFIGTNFIILNRLPIGEMVRDMRDATGLCEEHIDNAIDILNNKNKGRTRILHR